MNSNKFTFTDAKIRSLKPVAGKQYEVWDEKISSFGCRVSPKGSRAFVLLYRFKGKSRRYTIGHYPSLTLSEARKKALQASSDVAKGVDPAATKKEAKSSISPFAEIVKDYIEKYAKPRNKSWKETERILNKDFASRWSKRDIRDISKNDLLSILDRISAEYPSAANHAYRAINKFFNWAVERSIIEVSPSQGLSLPCKVEKRLRVLSDTELKSVWNAAIDMSYPYGKIIQLLILTGQRRGEISSMRWSDIDFVNQSWIIPAELNKSGREHQLPLAPKAFDIITSIPKTDANWLFPARGSDKSVSGFSKWKNKLNKLSDVTDWVVHDLRRTTATGLASKGVEPHIIEKILNHSTGTLGGIAGTYNKYKYQDEMLDALNLWEKHISMMQ